MILHKAYVYLLIIGIIGICSMGFVSASEIRVEMPEESLPSGVTTTLPVVITDIDGMDTFTLSIPVLSGITVSVNESMTNSLREGYFINNAYSDTEKRLAWIDLTGEATLSGDRVVIFYLDITPAEGAQTAIPLTLNLLDIGINGDVSPVTSYIVPQNGVQQTPSPQKTESTNRPVSPAEQPTETITPEELLPPVTDTAESPDTVKTSLSGFAVFAGLGSAVLYSIRRGAL